MSWKLDSERPIYLQLVEKIQVDIVSGKYELGDKLPSVRELAALAVVNPNTMQKALQELERMGLVHAERTSGRFITSDKKLIDKLRDEKAKNLIKEFCQEMNELGFSKDEIMKKMEEVYE